MTKTYVKVEKESLIELVEQSRKIKMSEYEEQYHNLKRDYDLLLQDYNNLNSIEGWKNNYCDMFFINNYHSTKKILFKAKIPHWDIDPKGFVETFGKIYFEQKYCTPTEYLTIKTVNVLSIDTMIHDYENKSYINQEYEYEYLEFKYLEIQEELEKRSK